MKMFVAACALLMYYLVLTCLAEGLVIGLWFRKWKYIKYSIACNLVTNPLFNLCAAVLEAGIFGVSVDHWILFWGGECIVFLVEAYIYHYITGFKCRKCLAMSLVANVCSMSIGILIDMI